MLKNHVTLFKFVCGLLVVLTSVALQDGTFIKDLFSQTAQRPGLNRCIYAHYCRVDVVDCSGLFTLPTARLAPAGASQSAHVGCAGILQFVAAAAIVCGQRSVPGPGRPRKSRVARRAGSASTDRSAADPPAGACADRSSWSVCPASVAGSLPCRCRAVPAPTSGPAAAVAGGPAAAASTGRSSVGPPAGACAGLQSSWSVCPASVAGGRSQPQTTAQGLGSFTLSPPTGSPAAAVAGCSTGQAVVAAAAAGSCLRRRLTAETTPPLRIRKP